MSRPIEATPDLSAEDWQDLMADLRKGCSLEEAKRRAVQAQIYLDAMTKKKGA